MSSAERRSRSADDALFSASVSSCSTLAISARSAAAASSLLRRPPRPGAAFRPAGRGARSPQGLRYGQHPSEIDRVEPGGDHRLHEEPGAQGGLRALVGHRRLQRRGSLLRRHVVDLLPEVRRDLPSLAHDGVDELAALPVERFQLGGVEVLLRLAHGLAELEHLLDLVGHVPHHHVGEPGGASRLAQGLDLPGQLGLAVGPGLLRPVVTGPDELARQEPVEVDRGGQQVTCAHRLSLPGRWR
nr:hypothetical protein DA06_08985 [Georgenia sp. SUBG003]